MKKGFAAMDPEDRHEICSKGGKSAHEQGTAHEFTSDEAREAGRKGGQTVARDREHMSRIGRKGGTAVSSDREHMSRIGKKGGASVAKDTEHMRKIGRKGGHNSSKKGPTS